MLAIIAFTLFVVGYIFITLEHKFHLHKALSAAFLGAFLWVLIGFTENRESFSHALEAVGAEIFGLVIFLLAAMTLVEILTHYRFFDVIRVRILSLGLHDRWQLWVMGAVAFILSPLIDNLTATLVMLAISTRFFVGKNLLRAAAIIVIAANAGGAWSPIGDVTTLMLWLAGKFSAFEVIAWGFLPSLALFFVSTFMLTRGVSRDSRDVAEEKITLLSSEKVVITLSLLSFGLPFVMSQIGLEPYFGLVLGLGIVGTTIALMRITFGEGKRRKKVGEGEQMMHHGVSTHLSSDIEKQLARVDMASLLFFTGILLAVGALEHLGILEFISHLLLGEAPSIVRLVAGSSILGVLSAIMDNIPLTAAAIDILNTTTPAIWVLLALAVGTGGSLLVIGSAAGVVAMGKVKDLTFFKYLSIATVPAAVGYVAAIAVWSIQYALFG